MHTPLLTFTIERKRDLLRARKAIRQAAELLGLHGQDQICITAAGFDLACQAHQLAGRATLQLDIVDDCLQILCSPGSVADPNPLRVSKPLPASPPVPHHDVPWLLQQLTDMAPGDLFGEVSRLNRELLQTLRELAKVQPAATGSVPKQSEPNAA